jgi:tryptophan synthase alpha chain
MAVVNLSGIDDVFTRAKQESRVAFIPYVMAGDPNLETTGEILRALTRAGADLIELGIPYGDPLADGPTIAAAGMRALKNGIDIAQVLTFVRVLRSEFAPIVLFTYFNPIYQYGLQRFADDAAAAGVAGVIVPDLALEELAKLRKLLLANGLVMPLLVAPSTSDARATRIVKQSTGFVYVVSRMGVTGAANAPDFSPFHNQIESLRKLTSKPLAVGFGISKPEHVREVAPLVDGIVIGSALIDAYTGAEGEAAAARAERFLGNLVAASR